VHAALLHEPLHDIEQLRHLLHLVDHNELGAVPALLLDQQLGVLQVAPVGRRQQQVDPWHVPQRKNVAGGSVLNRSSRVYFPMTT
jgi:hypothetical protein